MNLPRGYNKKLGRKFPQLRVRWSDHHEFWMLEERISYPRTVNPDRYPREALDSFRRFSDGYRLLDQWPPQRLPSVDRLVTGLRQGSVQRIMDELGVKNAEQWAAAMDARDARRNAEKWRKDKERGAEYAGEFYDRLAWAEGRTVAASHSRR
jgi:hypothetical protein